MRIQNFIVAIFIPITWPVSAQTQASYPVINEAAQEARDSDRRSILEAERQMERGELAKAQSAYDAVPTTEGRADLHRHIENLKALQREIDGVSDRRGKVVPRVVVKGSRPSANKYARAKSTATFWDPYNRASDHSEFSITQIGERP
jgi:hypothetical protein